MLEKVKLALLISTNDFDTELTELITAAVLDLNIAGVDNTTVVKTEPTDALVSRAIVAFCAYNFELMHGEETRSERYKKVYDEQKAQMSMATNYTTW